MAAVIVFRNHLINNLQLPEQVVVQIIDVHGYDSVEEFASATDREIRDLISTIRKTPSIANDATSPKIVLGQTYAIRILHFMYYSRLIQKVGRQHTIGLADQATSTIAIRINRIVLIIAIVLRIFTSVITLQHSWKEGRLE